MRHLVCGLAMSVAVAAASPQAPAGAAEALQGRWMVTGGEHDGKPMDAIKGGVLTIAGHEFEIRTASGNLLKGTLRLHQPSTPPQMDLLHADGTVWEAIYEVDAATFRLNYVEAGGKDRRPETFSTSGDTEASIVTLRRDDRKQP